MEKLMIGCPLCGLNYQMGPGRYEGIRLKLYELTVCEKCWDLNWDGWHPDYEEFLIRHMRNKNFLSQTRTRKVIYRVAQECEMSWAPLPRFRCAQSDQAK